MLTDVVARTCSRNNYLIKMYYYRKQILEIVGNWQLRAGVDAPESETRKRRAGDQMQCSAWVRPCIPNVMPGFHHSVAVLPLPFHRFAVVKFRCSVKIT